MLAGFGARSANFRRKTMALESMSAKLMIADANLIITYLNASLVDYLRQNESEIRETLPNFRVDALIGQNIDIFHKDPPHQRQMLAAMRKPHNATIAVGGHLFDLSVVPLRLSNKTVGFSVEWSDAKERLLNLNYAAQIEAFGRNQAIIAFSPDATILSVNANFLRTFGYSEGEIVGRRHSLFVEPATARSAEYQEFWRKIGAGASQSGEFKRLDKSGREVWIQGAYNPILGADGAVVRVIKIATDVTPRVSGVNQIAEALTALASGDLTRTLTQPLTPELDRVRKDLNLAFENLRGTLKNVEQASEAIRSGASEIEIASNDLSRRTEQQAASLEESTAALNQVTDAIKKTASSSDNARRVVGEAATDARRSNEIVNQTTIAMTAIDEASHQIGQIISVIDEIAFQTNLLALNAGVEAARAGEAGRGFAVVASEVRALAQRSAEAAKEIKGLVSNSGAKVAEGVALVAQTGEALRRIAEQVNKINGIIAEIANSAGEQAHKIAEVNIAIGEMDQISQQNAAMVEETTAATRTLAQQTVDLKGAVGHFRLDGETSGRRANPSDRVSHAA